MGLIRRKEPERGSSRRGACVDALLQQLAVMRQGEHACFASAVVAPQMPTVFVHLRVFAGASLAEACGWRSAAAA
jgi:hypothetical protein